MKLLGFLEYKNFKLSFYSFDSIINFFKEKNVDFKEIIDDNFFWFENFLFDILYEKFGDDFYNNDFKNFRIVFYGFFESHIKDSFEGFEENFLEEKNLLSKGKMVFNEKNFSFGLKYKLFLEK